MEFKARKIQVPDDNPFQNDKLEIRQQVENLSSLLKNLSSPIVFSINAPWGHGKTTFLEMLNANLKNDGNRTLFFSAWETDFAVDPLLAFLGEINQELNSLIDGDNEKNEAWQKAKKAGIHIIKKGIPALIKVGTAGVIDAEKIIEDEASKFAESLTKDIIDEYSKDKEAINHFKENITAVQNDLNLDTLA
jgi:predicted KAP-like P-loop ATPase